VQLLVKLYQQELETQFSKFIHLMHQSVTIHIILFQFFNQTVKLAVNNKGV